MNQEEAAELPAASAGHGRAAAQVQASWRRVGRSFGAVPPPSSAAMLTRVVQDLSGPLTAVLTSTTLLAADPGSLPPQTREIIESMQRQAVVLQNRSENLLCAAAIWDGSFHLRPRFLPLGGIASEVVQVVNALVHHRNQRLELSIQDEDQYLSLDARRIAQILIHLLLSASAQSPRGSTVGFRVSPSGSNIRVAVASRGPAPHEQLPGLFALFHQPLHAVGSDDTSLGLSVMCAIVEAHGGRVGARNRKGGGSRVWFELPRTNRPFASYDP